MPALAPATMSNPVAASFPTARTSTKQAGPTKPADPSVGSDRPRKPVARHSSKEERYSRFPATKCQARCPPAKQTACVAPLRSTMSVSARRPLGRLEISRYSPLSPFYRRGSPRQRADENAINTKATRPRSRSVRTKSDRIWQWGDDVFSVFARLPIAPSLCPLVHLSLLAQAVKSAKRATLLGLDRRRGRRTRRWKRNEWDAARSRHSVFRRRFCVVLCGERISQDHTYPKGLRAMNFGRVVRMAIRYKFTFAAAVFSALMVAILWGANIGAVYPVVEIVFKNKSVQQWVDEKIVENQR
jgi:hypothetical protein